MNRNVVLIVMLLAFAIVSTGCMAGPFTATNAVMDWSASTYADSTLLGTVVYVFVTPIGWFGGMIVDEVFLNNVAWWGGDIWNGTGTTKIGTFHPNQGWWILDFNGNFIWDGTPSDKLFPWGSPGNTPVVGDWNGSD